MLKLKAHSGFHDLFLNYISLHTFFYDHKSKTIYIGLKKNLVVTTTRFIKEFFHDNKYKTLTSFFNESGSHNVWVHMFSYDEKSKII
jgi:hypothetical protein